MAKKVEEVKEAKPKEAIKKEVSKPEPKVVERKDKKVTMIPKITGKKFIGDGWYELEEGKAMKVPKNVRDLLQKQGKARI